MQVFELVDSAIRHAGTARALATQLGAQPQEVSDWRHGRRTCPPDMRARMAEMIGADPVQELADAIAEGLSEQRKAGLKATLERAGMAVTSVTVTAIIGAAMSVMPGSAKALTNQGHGEHNRSSTHYSLSCICGAPTGRSHSRFSQDQEAHSLRMIAPKKH